MLRPSIVLIRKSKKVPSSDSAFYPSLSLSQYASHFLLTATFSAWVIALFRLCRMELHASTANSIGSWLIRLICAGRTRRFPARHFRCHPFFGAISRRSRRPVLAHNIGSEPVAPPFAALLPDRPRTSASTRPDSKRDWIAEHFRRVRLRLGRSTRLP
jgi:hypothetical protein